MPRGNSRYFPSKCGSTIISELPEGINKTPQVVQPDPKTKTHQIQAETQPPTFPTSAVFPPKKSNNISSNHIHHSESRWQSPLPKGGDLESRAHDFQQYMGVAIAIDPFQVGFHQKGAPWSNFFIKLWGDLMRLFTWAPGRNPNGNRRNLRVCVKPCCRLCMVTFETITGGTFWTSMACGISCYNFLCVLVSNKSLWKNTYIYIHTNKAIKNKCMKTLPKDLCPGRIHWHHWHHIHFTYITYVFEVQMQATQTM